jgi:hypothetical protein
MPKILGIAAIPDFTDILDYLLFILSEIIVGGEYFLVLAEPAGGLDQSPKLGAGGEPPRHQKRETGGVVIATCHCPGRLID